MIERVVFVVLFLLFINSLIFLGQTLGLDYVEEIAETKLNRFGITRSISVKEAAAIGLSVLDNDGSRWGLSSNSTVGELLDKIIK
jgi:hypothetical protein